MANTDPDFAPLISQAIMASTPDRANNKHAPLSAEGTIAMSNADQKHNPDGSPIDPNPEETSRQVQDDMRLNAVVKSHMRRQSKELRDDFRKELEALKAQFSAGPKRAGGGDVGEVAALREELEQMRREKADAERQSRRDSVSRQTLEALSAKGIVGIRAKALIALMREEGALSDDGRLTVTRIREKGGRPEPLEFDDIVEGISDWARTSGAMDFLPAPGWDLPAGQRNGSSRPPAMPKYSRPPKDKSEAAARTVRQLSAMGVDLQNRRHHYSSAEERRAIEGTLEALEKAGINPQAGFSNDD